MYCLFKYILNNLKKKLFEFFHYYFFNYTSKITNTNDCNTIIN